MYILGFALRTVGMSVAIFKVTYNELLRAFANTSYFFLVIIRFVLALLKLRRNALCLRSYEENVVVCILYAGINYLRWLIDMSFAVFYLCMSI